jgi:hypothetical protein
MASFQKRQNAQIPESVGPLVFAASFVERTRDRKFFREVSQVTTPVSRFWFFLLFGFIAVSATASAFALESPVTDPPAVALPDSPGALLSSPLSSSSSSSETPDEAPFDGQATGSSTKPTALPRVKLITAGQPAPKQEAHDKVLLGLRESVTPFTMLGWVTSAGWAQLIDGSPNYGTNGKAFAERLGAAAALSSSKEIFSDSILATAFHQDPRYYQLGKGHKFINRALYAGTRPVVGRTDSGKTIPNYAFMLGTGGAAALTLAYYPERNQTGTQVLQTWATSLGGSALGYLVSEFGGEVIDKLRIGKHE